MKSLLIALTYLVVFAAAAPILLYRFEAPQNCIELTSAGFSGNGGTSSPQYAQLRILPDDWRSHGGAPADGIYEIEFAVPTQRAELWSLVIPAVRQNAEVLINGQRLGSGGNLTKPVTRNLRRPLLFTLPDEILQPNSNTLNIRVVTAPDRLGYLSAVFIGPDRSLRPAFQRHYFWRVTVAQIITTFTIIVAGAVGLLALLRREDQEYAWFAIAALVWAAHSLTYFVADVPLPDRLWDWLGFLTLGWFAILGGVIYVHRYLGIVESRMERPIVVLGAIMSLGMLLLPDAWFYPFAYQIWHPICLTLAGYGLARMLLATWQRDSIQWHVVNISGVLLVTFAVHDYLLVANVLDWGRGYLIHYAMPFVLFFFCVILLRRFAISTQEVELMRDQLELLVEQRNQELATTSAQLRESERQRVLVTERQRIMRDMHDGVGGQLISTLTTIKQGTADLEQVEQSLQAALDDLRIMIDSLDEDVGSIPTLLGMFRQRVEPAIEAQKMRLSWDVAAIDDLPNFGAHEALHLLRILQEFVTNTLRHSGAGQIRLAATESRGDDSRSVAIHVSDDGQGIPDKATGGRGLDNMKFRAAAIGAEYRLASDGTGTTVELILRR